MAEAEEVSDKTKKGITDVLFIMLFLFNLDRLDLPCLWQP
jgi:hypothetical protein